ncbi:Cationic amino acid transporter 7, chloroplastic [Zea mays]|uniref:Cationic amino acid transporter 6 chloroplastic n=2 Tax=Zea mays TaxID=4577 RepID=K7TR83_MAIZE|nr:Cationic amino acid transporter 6 chloroplastic [Zea mays]PWZ44226.1 Cationic amino acid transporter 7, chloroplastic [Zea mays]
MALRDVLLSIAQTPHRLRRRALVTWTPTQELNEVRDRSGARMKRRLEWYDLVGLGVGGMLGAGVFVTTGRVARDTAGPAVFASYVVAGVSALLSSLCYAEFSVRVPVAGGAFSYLRVTFASYILSGEFVGFFGGANILMEYVLSNAAVARSFTDYLASTFGVTERNAWRIVVDGIADGYNELDVPAVALILLITVCLCYSTKESSMLNMVLTVFHLLFFAFIVAAGLWNGSARNLVRPHGLAPYGVRGVLDGAAVVYFSYIGYDSACTMAEEIRDPSRALPVGIAGSVLVVSGLYCLMSVALCVMLPYTEISEAAPFSSAFREKVGWRWASSVVGAGASIGIVASLMVAMLGQARYLCVIARARLVPLWFAKVHPSTGTPMNATIFLGFCTASLALFTELQIVFEMISIGTLLVFYLVANALIYHRYVKVGTNRPLHVLLFLLLLTLSSLGFSLSRKIDGWCQWGMTLFGAVSIAITTIFHCTARQDIAGPSLEWSVPLMPWPAAASVFLNVFLITTLKVRSYQRFGIWSLVTIVFYVCYGVHSTYSAEENEIVNAMIHHANLDIS